MFLKYILAILAAVLLTACARQPLVAPSGAGVSSGIGRTGTSIADAKRYNDLAVIHNANAKTRVERIQAKVEVIKRYWGK